MAKQNNSLTELQALEGIYEHLSAMDDLSKEVNVMVTKLSKIEQSQSEYKTALSTMITLTESMIKSFDEMKKTRAAGTPITVCRKDDVSTSVRSEVKSAVNEAVSGFHGHMDRMADNHKRPPLLTIRMNLSAKVLAVIMAIEILVGAIACFGFINTPMYLGNELYQSYERLNYPNPGAGYHNAHQLVNAGERQQLKNRIRSSENKERSYIAYRDTLRQLLNDQSIFINRIQYENTERLIDYTDSTDIIKSAHFRKDGSIRITDSPEVLTLHDARTMKKVRWIDVK